jgi:hypothetical protein
MREKMQKYFEITVKITVCADDKQSAYDIVEGDIDSLVSDSDQLQNYFIADTIELE